jgi:PPOX class probable F420-dependent enzyme
MTVELSPKILDLINKSEFVWFTTVRADGMPQPTPVWFIWDNGTFLIYSQPAAQKVRNLQANTKVALGFSRDLTGEEYAVIMGEAFIDSTTPPPIGMAAYLEKYRQGIADINMTPESMSAMFSTAIRVKPLRTRGE